MYNVSGASIVVLQHGNKDLLPLASSAMLQCMHCRALQCYASVSTMTQCSPLPTLPLKLEVLSNPVVPSLLNLEAQEVVW
jgi:hypothetical protein